METDAAASDLYHGPGLNGNATLELTRQYYWHKIGRFFLASLNLLRSRRV
jgi:hypothetical protein